LTPTLKQIADIAGVSYQTVWRAMHGRGRIAESTRQKIMKIAGELDYRTNRLAAGLRTKKSYAVGLLLIDVSNNYTGRLARAIEKRLTAAGYFVILLNTDEKVEIEIMLLRSLVDRQIDGLIISPADDSNYYLNDLIAKGFPVVAINKPVTGIDYLSITSANAQAGREALEYFYKKGHTKVGGVFGPLTSRPFHDRMEGFIQAAAEFGMTVRNEWLHSGANLTETGYNAVQALFSGNDRPTGLFCTSYRLTEGALQSAIDLGISRETDLEVVGFDLNYSRFLSPPIAVMRQQVEQLAENAVSSLIQMLEGNPHPQLSPPPILLDIPSELERT